MLISRRQIFKIAHYILILFYSLLQSFRIHIISYIFIFVYPIELLAIFVVLAKSCPYGLEKIENHYKTLVNNVANLIFVNQYPVGDYIFIFLTFFSYLITWGRRK